MLHQKVEKLHNFMIPISVILFHGMKEGLLRLTLSKIMCNISATVQHRKNSAKIAFLDFITDLLTMINATQNFE